MNPEFQRNLWLELPNHRLISMPAVLLLVFLAGWMGGGFAAVPTISLTAIALLLIVWGSRLAADAVLGEVVARTWDAQRMSALSPWEMTWGKLAGSTVYVWYGAAWCAAAYLVAANGDPVDLVRLLLAGFQAQALAMLVSVLLLRRGVESLQFQVVVSQVIAILAVLPLHSVIVVDPAGYVSWYGQVFTQAEFVLGSQALFLIWTVVGVYRLMRAELQYRAGQTTWLSFVLFLVIYVAGIDGLMLLTVGTPMPSAPAARLFEGFLTAVVLTYIAVFVEPKSAVRLRHWVHCVQTGRMDRVVEMTPAWLLSGAVALGVAAMFVVALLLGATPEQDPIASYGPLILAFLLFLVRDVSIVYSLVLQEGARRTHLAAAIYLILLYFIAPVVLDATKLTQLIPVFVPTLSAPALMVVVPVLLQALLALVIVLRRWQAVQVIDAERPGGVFG